ncbi:DUF2156 domain-containing protein [bacterium]|nr:MAG: DUF2156 domain-containing protein [bacterium]
MTQLLLPRYPRFTEITLGLRPQLNPIFKKLSGGISEFTFANIYLFRNTHNYHVSILQDKTPVFSGSDGKDTFFMLPLGMPDKDTLKRLFADFSFMKNASEEQANALEAMGYIAQEDRNNFDYVYSSQELKDLSGRQFHKKKNLINTFLRQYQCEGKALLSKRVKDALEVIEAWRKENDTEGDCVAATEAVNMADELALCAMIYYIGKKPVAFTVGEELKNDTFAVHFEKGVQGFKGLMQFVNQNFVAMLAEKYLFINREQDIEDEGLRQAKLSYHPSTFVKKYKVTA